MTTYSKNYQQYFWMMAAFVALTILPDAAMAVLSPLTTTLCSVVDVLTGGLGQAIAAIAIIVIGIGALMGKVSWGMAIIVGLGVAVVFGADEIVNQLGADADAC